MKYKYIRFDDYSVKGQKTKRFMCMNRNHGSLLGEVKWLAGWRQYCFFPQSSTVFSKGCMEDINDFIAKLMAERAS